MLKNSYDASGFHFGIAVSPRLQELDTGLTSTGPVFNRQDSEKITRILESVEFVDFSNIDGLTLDEITRCYTNKSNIILFVIWESLGIKKEDEYYTNEKTLVNYRTVFHKGEWNKDVPIDELVENHMLVYYPRYDERLQKIAKCFLQRYRYGTKEETDKVLELVI